MNRYYQWIAKPIAKYSLAVSLAIILPYLANPRSPVWLYGAIMAVAFVGLYMVDEERRRKKREQERK
jgi:hypothetical protein